MNKRTTKTIITWHVEMDEYQDQVFQTLLKHALSQSIWDSNQKQFFSEWLHLVPKGETDEKTSTDDDDLLSLDDDDFSPTVPAADASATERLATLASICRGGYDCSKPEDRAKFPRGPAYAQGDKGNR
jgi:hypothetical protein